ncbi:hypothetical protein GWI33_015783 [Rhynchophorus ferrugineus]|uniref:Fibronectin type III domain-containing protein n=1 Tax=Rhynchophorus ferrugineus TaxID=354439 RepID=A0A834I4Q2_RHYFE|nr:hypothetical protein GWI33_015783 [Rhynchophorus ferrugineus]
MFIRQESFVSECDVLRSDDSWSSVEGDDSPCLIDENQVHAQPPRTPRPRLNSAIFVSNSGPGIDPKEFFRRHGSVSKLCRKARSVDNISLEEKHFGLPTLSISGPSPPEADEETEINETQKFLA